MNTQEDKVLEAIYEALRSLNTERADNEQIALREETCLFGEGSALDSLSLVSVIVDVETALSNAYGKSVSLTDDRAMSRSPVPFTNVSTLKSYVLELVSA